MHKHYIFGEVSQLCQLEWLDINKLISWHKRHSQDACIVVVLLNVGSPSNPSLVQVAMSFVSLSTLECHLAARKDIKGHSLKPRLKSTPNQRWENDFVSAARENFDLVCHQGLSVRHAQVEIYFETQPIQSGPKKWLSFRIPASYTWFRSRNRQHEQHFHEKF